MVIWKFPLSERHSGIQEMQLPFNARILTIQENEGRPTLYAVVNPDTATELRRFTVQCTGDTVPDSSQFLGTCQLHGGRLVLHVFELQ